MYFIMYIYILLHSTYILDVLIIVHILHFQAIQDIILKGHRQAFVWIDEWHGRFYNVSRFLVWLGTVSIRCLNELKYDIYILWILQGGTAVYMYVLFFLSIVRAGIPYYDLSKNILSYYEYDLGGLLWGNN